MEQRSPDIIQRSSYQLRQLLGVSGGDSASAPAINGRRMYATDSVAEAEGLGSEVLGPHLLRAAGRGDFHASYGAVQVGSLSLAQLTFSDRIRARTRQPLRGYCVLLPVAGRVQVRSSRGAVLLEPGSGCVLNPSDFVDKMTLEARTTELLVSIPSGTVARYFTDLCSSRHDQPVFDLSPTAFPAWFGALSLVLTTLERCGAAPIRPSLAEILEAHAVQALLLSHQHTCSAALFTEHDSDLRDKVMQAARDLEADLSAAPSVTRIAQSYGLSARVLRDGFREFVGQSPTGFIRNARLDEAHRRLADASADATTIAQVAHDVGFTHLGRFAAAYRQRFGAPPSATLRQSRN